MIAAVIAIAIVATAAIALIGAALAAVIKAKDAQRVAEVTAARFEEAVIAEKHAVDVAEGLHKAERERADVLEEELHDADIFIATSGGAAGATAGPGRSRLLSALKRVANHAAGPSRARGAGDPSPDPVPVATAARGSRARGEPPTAPGDR